MEMIIGVIADSCAGGTFLAWSLHYLAGHTTYFSTKEKKYIDLIDDPLTNSNAHKYRANHPINLSQFDEYIDSINITPTNLFHTIYIHHLRSIDPLNLTDILIASDQLQNIDSAKIVILNFQKRQVLYHSKLEGRFLGPKIKFPNVINTNFEEQLTDFIDTHFSESKIIWDKLNLNNIWDQREFLALNLRPHNDCGITQSINLTKPHYQIDAFEMFHQFDKTVISLFDYLDLNIDTDRWDHWLKIYRKWQMFHVDRVLFVEYFDIIITSIINNYYLDLIRFKLDIVREAVIQHELIYKYGLTIKGWGLEKFPNNTQDLHKLLEPNTHHQVKDIYNCLKRK